jgi:hypothetical protein
MATQGGAVHRIRTTAVAVAAAALLAAPAAARAVGPPPSTMDGLPGVVAANGAVRYVTYPAGASATLVQARSVEGGGVLRSLRVPLRVGVPDAAGRTGTGLSQDGRTLVLASKGRTPGDLGNARRRTTLVALATSFAAAPRSFTLPGDFAVDAISPQGRVVYLIERRTTDFLRYVVRAFDLRSGALVPGIIAEKGESGNMYGYPIARATASHGRYALTLYAGLGRGSFVHVLDTVTGTARCVDLPSSIPDGAIWELRLVPDGAPQRLGLTSVRGRSYGWIDLRTLHLHRPQPA